ncbi:MAG: hypothetical protein V4547_09210 [Bacteroidota bacterium]
MKIQGVFFYSVAACISGLKVDRNNCIFEIKSRPEALLKITQRDATSTGASKPAGTKEVLGKLIYEIVGTKTLPTLEKYRMTSLIK